MVKCKAVQHSDRMRCARCDLSWDVGDPAPPLCASFIAPDFLDDAAATFRERNALYGNNYQRAGALLLALFPKEGVPVIQTQEDALRLSIIVDCLKKLQRYAHNFERGGHRDSAHDLMVYAAMLEEATE